MTAYNPYASAFGSLLETRFSETADAALAELAYLFAPNGLRWLPSRRERVDSFGVLDDVKAPIRQAMVINV
jgi:hypothetical protein